MRFKLIIIALLVITAVLLQAEIPPETVLVEHSSGSITMGEFNQRLEQIPAMYQGRYQTYEGKVKFLNDLVTEEVFYLEALSLGLDNDPEIEEKVQNQIQSTYYSEYQKFLKETEIKISDDEMYEYFLKNIEDYPGITFEEAKTMVEKTYRQERETEFFTNYDQKLMEKYDITIHENLLDSLDFNDPTTYEPIGDQKYVTSNNSDLEKTISDLKEFYEGLPNRNKMSLLRAESRLNSVKEMTKVSLYYQEAVDAGFQNNEKVLETMPMLRRNLMLRETYNRLVTEQLDVSEQTVREYYDTNLEKFSTKPFRKIQAFGFNDEKSAKKALKIAKKAVKKDNQELLKEVLASSVFEFENGELDHIYKNQIIPKCGRDSLWCDLVWETESGKSNPKDFSEIFLSAQGNYVFFRILEDTLPIATPYDEARIKIENEMRQERSRELFTQEDKRLREKYNVVILEDNLVEKLTPEEYFTNAEKAQKKRRFKDAIYYYDQICKYYANGVDDYKALFMKGFIYSEEMQDKEKAIAVFEQLLEKYPQGELHESAQFMIEELKGNSNILEKMEGN